jgi:nucleoside-diphosphate-sugar epimerase
LTSIKPDFIFHLASHVVGARDLDIVPPTFYSNLASTVNILTVATEIGCTRVILVGSLEEPDEHDITAIPCSPYAAAKWACSGYARMFHALYNTPVSIARLFMVYGPGQQDLRKLIPHVTLSLLRNEAPRLTSGYRKIDWIYVEDVVEGLLLMGHVPGIEGCTLDLGSGSLATIRTVVEQLIVAIGSDLEPIYGALPVRAMEQVRIADTRDTLAKIGWKPRTDLKNGLQATVDWYREHYHVLRE